MKNQLSITVDTTDATTLNELSFMFSRLAGSGMIALPEPQVGILTPIPRGESDAVARKNAEDNVSQAEYADQVEHERKVAAEEAVVDSDPLTAPIDPSVAFGGSVPPPPVAATTVELDSAGMPWDARIHAGSKSKVTNGTWKLLRGVDPELVKAVKAEYLGNDVSTPMPNSEPTAKPPVEATTNPVVPPPPSVASTPVVGGMTYEQAIDHLISVKKVPVHVIQQRCIANGIPTFPLLANPENAHLIPIIVDESVIANEKRLLEAGTSNG